VTESVKRGFHARRREPRKLIDGTEEHDRCHVFSAAYRVPDDAPTAFCVRSAGIRGLLRARRLLGMKKAAQIRRGRSRGSGGGDLLPR
jgi:hypothetical protein